MNNDNQKVNQSTETTPPVLPPAYPYPQFAVAGQQFMYVPQSVQFGSSSPTNPEKESLVESIEPS
jgi:hypothetical protein